MRCSVPYTSNQTTANISTKEGNLELHPVTFRDVLVFLLQIFAQKPSDKPPRVTHKTPETVALRFQQCLCMNNQLHINIIWKSHYLLWSVLVPIQPLQVLKLCFTLTVLIPPSGIENMYFLCLAAALLAFPFTNMFSAFSATEGEASSI